MRVYKISTDLTKEREELLSSTFSREEEKTIFNYFDEQSKFYNEKFYQMKLLMKFLI